jgi:hypothetical protein
MRRSGGGKGVLPPDWPTGVVGEWEPGELRGAVEHMVTIRIRESSGEEGEKGARVALMEEGRTYRFYRSSPRARI